MNIFIVEISRELSKEEFKELASLISEEKRKRIETFHFYADAQRSLLGDVLVRYAVNECYHIQNKSLVFTINKYGKPSISSFPNIQFNISHAGEYVVCAVNDRMPVGIDIEVIKPIGLDIAKRFFSVDEYAYLSNQRLEQRTQSFYSLWTMKESYTKMVGKGFSIPLSSFSVLDNTTVYFQQFIQNEKIIGNVCCEMPKTIKCKYVCYEELVSIASKM